MSNDFLSELEKIANFSTDVVAPDDVASESMVPDTAPHVDPKTVEMVQTANANVPTDADDQLPANPEDDKALAEAIGQAQQEYESAKEHLASLEEDWSEKTAENINSQLPAMGALARLIDYSTNDSVSEELRKLASDRLIAAMKDADEYVEILEKTAGELFEDEENLDQLYSKAGKDYVLEHLASLIQDEELEKVAFEVGGILTHAQQVVGDYVDGARNLWKLQDQIDAAKQAVDEAQSIASQKRMAVDSARDNQTLEPSVRKQIWDDWTGAVHDHQTATKDWSDQQNLKRKGQQVWFGGGALGAGGAFMGGKAIANGIKSRNESEEELSEKSASVTINLGNNDHIKGGNPKMSIVKDFLKIAGAAGLLELANNEGVDMELRKEAAESFNAISRMNRYDMEASFEKMATQIYSEPQLHEIVAGQHTDYLFDKIAYFTELNDLGADELEKVAGADGVAAKGVAGALTDAKSNIEEKVKSDKEHTETVKNGELGTRKPDDMRGYSVINNPGQYKVEKTAAHKVMIEEAELRKEAAYREFVTADAFIKANR